MTIDDGFMVYSLGSCDETKYWLELGRDLGHFPREDVVDLLKRFDSIGRMLLSLLRKT